MRADSHTVNMHAVKRFEVARAVRGPHSQCFDVNEFDNVGDASLMPGPGPLNDQHNYRGPSLFLSGVELFGCGERYRHRVQ